MGTPGGRASWANAAIRVESTLQATQSRCHLLPLLVFLLLGSRWTPVYAAAAGGYRLPQRRQYTIHCAFKSCLLLCCLPLCCLPIWRLPRACICRRRRRCLPLVCMSRRRCRCCGVIRRSLLWLWASLKGSQLSHSQVCPLMLTVMGQQSAAAAAAAAADVAAAGVGCLLRCR